MLSAISRKTISGLLLLSLILPPAFLTSPRKTEAFAVVATNPDLVLINETQIIPILTGVLPGQAQKEGGLFGLGYDGIAYFAGRILIRQLTQSIVDWINSGFEGNPSFVQDPLNFLEDSVDRTIGEFIFAGDLKFLCEPFEIDIRLSLGLQYSPFKDKINCRLSDILQNVDGAVTDVYENFMNGDFIGGGGWDTWLEVTTIPQNNKLGAMLIAQSELDISIANQKNLDKDMLNWSGGILSYQECKEEVIDQNGTVTEESTYRGDPRYRSTAQTSNAGGVRGNTVSDDIIRQEDVIQGPFLPGTEPSGYIRQSCKIITPGSLITDQMQKITGADLEALQVADEINEIVGALANFLITKVMEKGLANVTKEELSADDANWRAGISSLRSQQYSSLSSGAPTSVSYNPPASSIYGGGNGGGTTPGGEDINAIKSNILATIGSYVEQEQNYNIAYTTILNKATTTSTALTSAIACYNGKINGLSGSTKTAAQTSLNTLNEKLTQTQTTRTTANANLSSSNTNLTNLQSISSSVSSATTIDQIVVAGNSLANLAPSLHSWDINAYDVATLLVSQLDSNTTLATTEQNICSAL